jgi:uncharacterized protein
MAGGGDLPWREAEGCVIVRVRLTPKSSQDAIQGLEATAEGPAFKARVRAIPAEGEANRALLGLVAGWLRVPKSSVLLSAGAKSRVKSLSVSGDVERITKRLEDEVQRLASS